MGKKILIEVPEELHRRLKVRAAEKGVTLKKAVEEAIKMFAEGYERPIVIQEKDVVDLSEFCKGLTMKECVEKIKKEIPDYRKKLYRITIEV